MRTLAAYIENIWPFSTFTYDDLRESNRIVRKLQIPESTKNFVYAVREPESQAVIYVLSVQNLSERSARDAEGLIREIKPDAVVVQVGGSNSADISGKTQGGDKVVGIDDNAVPTSSFEVVKNCFMHRFNGEKYEILAGKMVLREIFGVDFDANLLAAKKAADEVGSSFFMLESPFVKCSKGEHCESTSDTDKEVVNIRSGFQNALNLQLNNLVPGRVGYSMIPPNTIPFCVTNDLQSRMVRSLSTNLIHSNPVSMSGKENLRPVVDYDVPQFAKSVYPLLRDLHDIFSEIPSMGTALACAQKMLSDINRGEMVDTQLLSEIFAFQIAVEGLRIALNNAGRLSMSKIRNSESTNCEFSELPVEDKSHAILAQALRSRSKTHKSIVAVIDASGLAGLRKHWKTDIPPEIKSMVEELVIDISNDGELSSYCNRKRLLTDKPVVAVGAGATAILGASSLSKVIPASAFMKVATFHVPASLQLMLTQTQKAVLFSLGKVFGPTKIIAPGMASSTLKSSAAKAVASAEKIRVVAHSVIASAEKTSLSAMRAAFYEIMRKRRVQPLGVKPWVTFGCSIATCTGLLLYGDGIECAAESFPAAPSIASLGRGIQSLREASLVLKQEQSSRIQRSIETLLYKFKNIKVQ